MEAVEAQDDLIGPGAEPEFAYPALEWHQEAFRIVERPGTRGLVITGAVYTGKTNWASFLAFHLATSVHRGSLIWWIAGNNFQIGAMWNGSGKPDDGPGFRAAAQAVGARIKNSPYREAVFPRSLGGSKVQCVTAKNIDLLASFHPDVIFVDEPGKIPSSAWERIYGRFPGTKLIVVFGSADYQPMFAELIELARKGEHGYHLLEVSAERAGILTKAEIAHLKHILPARVFRRDVQGIMQRGTGGVFERILEAHRWPDGTEVQRLGPKAGERYVIGYDQAKVRDYSYVAVRKTSTNQIVQLYRWQRMEYHAQARLVLDVSARFNNAEIFMDATGALAVLEIMYRERARRSPKPRLYPIWFGGADVRTKTKRPVQTVSKELMVDRLSVALSGEELKMPGPEYGDDYAEAERELEAFEMKQRAGGLSWQYGAPANMHDDAVIAIGLTLLESRMASMPVSFLDASAPWRPMTRSAIESMKAGEPFGQPADGD